MAYLLEQRCGKTKLTLDVVAHQYNQHKIDALLIIGPNGVHRNWATDEIPRHLHELTDYRCHVWRSNRDTQQTRTDLNTLLTHPGLAVLTVNSEAIITPRLKTYLKKFLTRRRVFGVIDESLDVSSAGAKRTRTAMAIGRHCVARRILDGTAGDAGPLGLYSQFEFLQPGCLGFYSALAFRAHFARWKTRDVGEHDRVCPECAKRGRVSVQQAERILGDTVVRSRPHLPPDPAALVTCPRCAGDGFVGRRAFPQLVGYQNLDELHERLQPVSYRVLRADCADLPPKIYEKRYFELTPTQRDAYDELRETFRLELREAGTVTAAMVLTRYLRLQQITSNFLPLDTEATICEACQGEGCPACGDVGFTVASGGHPRAVPVDLKHDPRLEALLTWLAPLTTPGVIWARWRRDFETITRALREAGRRPVGYHGGVHPEQRAANLAAFRAGDVDILVGNPRTGGRGLDLAVADHVTYYSHDWPLRLRRQSEDRAQNLSKTGSVLYGDIVAEDTIDEKIIDALREGKNLADLVMGDPGGEWI